MRIEKKKTPTEIIEHYIKTEIVLLINWLKICGSYCEQCFMYIDRKLILFLFARIYNNSMLPAADSTVKL